MSKKVSLIHYDGDVERENFHLIAKVIYLIDSNKLWSEDDTFTFPDGETWGRFDPEGRST